MLKFQLKDRSRSALWVVEKPLTIGQAKTNSLAIDDPRLATTHAKLEKTAGTISLKDMAGQADITVNGSLVTQKALYIGDEFSLNGVEFEIIDPYAEQAPYTWALIADSSWLSGKEFPLNPKTTDADVPASVTVGRGKHCDLVFAGTHLSREHARLELHNNYLILHDLDSANGSFVNGKRVHAHIKVLPGDQIRLDVHTFRVFGPGMSFQTLGNLSLTGANSVIQDSDVLANEELKEKRWKTKPTSYGNREELSHYDKNYGWLYAVIAGILFMAALSFLLFAS